MLAARPPEALLVGRRALDGIGEVAILDDLAPSPDGGWMLRLALSPTDLGDAVAIPATTEWYVTVSSQYPAGMISFFPSLTHGLEGWHPHQMRYMVEAEPGRPWRNGKICVATDTENNLRRTDDGEPRGVEDRLAWHTLRAVEWLRAASRGELLAAGDPFELPVFPGAGDLGAAVVAFVEGPETFAQWRDRPERSGLADVGGIAGQGTATGVVLAFKDGRDEIVVKPPWGTVLSTATTATPALWLRLDAMPVAEPWAAPATWGELRAAASVQGLDLDSLLGPLMPKVRRDGEAMVLVGFPVPAHVGDEPERLHWQPLYVQGLTPRPRRRRGSLHDLERQLWKADRERGAFADDQQIRWLKGENWHPDQIGTRGRLSQALCDQRVLLVGAGALGSAVGELLVRAGVTQLTVVDPDTTIAGNLVRHTLLVSDVGSRKAAALAQRLNLANPNATVAAVEDGFLTYASKASPEADASDLIIDTTGDPFLISFLRRRTWSVSKAFVSISFSYGARRLYFFRHESETIDTETFEREVAPWVQLDRDAELTPPMEGIGCWHPVFPARADEVWLQAAVAVATLEVEHARRPWTDPKLTVFERTEDAEGLPRLEVVRGAA